MADHKTWIEPLARGGYAARGFVFAIIGTFAVLASFGAGQEKDTKGALMSLLGQPFGTVLIYALILGMIGYVIWRFVQALLDTDDHGFSPKGLAVRGGLLASGITYAALALYALSLTGVFASADAGDGQGPVASFFAGMVGQRWVSLALAGVFTGVAVAHFWKAVTRGYRKHFDTHSQIMRLVDPVAVLGLAARGTVFAIIAWLFVQRFMYVPESADEQPGMKAALDHVQGMPNGQWLLMLLGIGLLLFAGYSVAESIWRRINVEDAEHPADQVAG